MGSIQVSVVMPVHNCARYVRTAIDSILNQTFTDFEFIIIDDGSIDGTSSILLETATAPRVRVISQENMGLTRSLNKGVALARGKYIARQDADDISLLTRLEMQVDFLETHSDFGLVGSFVELIDEHGAVLQAIEPPIDNDQIQHYLPIRNCFIHGSVMIRKTSFDRVGGYRIEFPLAQDYDLWLRISESFKVANIPQVLYQYRKTKDGISYRMSALQETYIQIAKQLAQERRNHRSDTIMRGVERCF